jgi:phosphatidylinositol alpha-1,6-mannosyltransferase
VDVLLVSPDFPPVRGGIQILMHRLVVHMPGTRTRVLTLAAPGDACFDAAEGTATRRARVPGAGRHAAMAAMNALVPVEARARRPDVILSGHIAAAPGAVAARRLLGVPFVQYIHADEARAKPSLCRFAVRHADAVVAVSRYSAGLAVDAGADPGRVHVIPNGVDEPSATRAVPRDARPTVVSVARLADRYKGHDVLLRAMPLLRARVADARLVLVGDGPLRPSLEALAAAHGLNGAVSFAGEVDDAERDRWLDRAQAFAMPSRLPTGRRGGEGFGIAYLEAGAHELPVVAGNVGGALDAVEDGVTGLLVDPSDHVAVADALGDLLADHGRATTFGRAGYERARRFSWQATATAVAGLLEAVVRDSR